MARGRRKRLATAGGVAADAAEAGGGVDWASLPDGVLTSIAELLPSFSDLVASSFVCRSWRAPLITAPVSPDSRPPLLSSRGKGFQLWRVDDIASPKVHSRPIRSLHACQWTSFIAGVSRGCLILAKVHWTITAECFLTVLNPISGETIQSPPFPPATDDWQPRSATVRAIYLNSSTILVLLPSYKHLPTPSCVTVVLQWHIGAEEWASVHHLHSTNLICELTSLPDGRLFAVTCSEIFALGLEPRPTLTELAPLPSLPEDSIHVLNCSYSYLFTCGEVIMYLQLFLNIWRQFEVKVFRLAESVQGMAEWVQLVSLGDWAIFVTLQTGVPVVACRNPERWGGRSNSIYFAKCSGFKFGKGGNNHDGPMDGQIWHVVDTMDGPTGIYYHSFGKLRKLARQPQQILIAPRVLHGIGEKVAARCVPKVLLLNGSHDRETFGLSASEFVTAIANSLNRTHGDPNKCLYNTPQDYVNALLVPKNGRVYVDSERLSSQGIFRVVTVDSLNDPSVGIIFEPKALIQALTQLILDRSKH